MSLSDMHSKTCLITGANAGMGAVIARDLAASGANVVMVCRDPIKGEEARRQIIRDTGNTSVELRVADLADQSATRRVAREFVEHHSQLDVLINNAGAHIRKRALSVDGIEMNLAVNHLSAFLLTNLLLDTLKASASARVVNVASRAMTKTIDLTDIQSEGDFRPFKVYGRAKLAMVLCGYALARRLSGSSVTVNALHPGVTATKIVDDVFSSHMRPFVGVMKRFIASPEKGARATLFLATSPAVEGVTGKYFVKGREHRSVSVSYDETLQDRMWSLSEELVGLGTSTSGNDTPTP